MENLKSIFELVAAHPIVSLFLAVVFLESIIVIFKGIIAIISIFKTKTLKYEFFNKSKKDYQKEDCNASSFKND